MTKLATIPTSLDGGTKIGDHYTVPGIGPVIATELLIATNEMQTINDPKKVACHAGVAPFECRSGTSIRGKTKVSHQARKRLKSLIHMGTMWAIQVKGDLQDYYVRKLGERIAHRKRVPKAQHPQV